MAPQEVELPDKTKSMRANGKRGRPSREQERAITLSILDAALRLFLDHGYGATSMKRIGEAAGVAPNTLYLRYPTKAALFRAITEWKVALWKVTNPPRSASRGSPLYDVLEVAVAALFDAMEREDISAISRLLTLEAERFPELVSIYHEIATTVGQESLVDSIVHCSDNNISEAAAKDMARTVLEVAVGHMQLRMLNTGGGIESHRRAARRIARVFARADVDEIAQGESIEGGVPLP